ncbi:MAG: hypothetical protein NTW13_06050, partial [Candidatus Omnitrophica bacterium]|nr:hypothetical protein [Candidatus Omnitrophota bacterium]
MLTAGPRLTREEEIILLRAFQRTSGELKEEIKEFFLAKQKGLINFAIGKWAKKMQLAAKGAIIKTMGKFKFIGKRFSTPAMYFLRSDICQAQREAVNQIYIPVNIATRLPKFYHTREVFFDLWRREPTVKEIAEEMKIPENEVKLLIAASHSGTVSLHKKLGENEEAELMELIPVKDEPVHFYYWDCLVLLSHASPIKGLVLKLRRGFGTEKGSYMLREIGIMFGRSHQRIQQLEARALKKLRKIAKQGFLGKAAAMPKDDYTDVYIVETLGISPRAPCFAELLKKGKACIETEIKSGLLVLAAMPILKLVILVVILLSVVTLSSHIATGAGLVLAVMPVLVTTKPKEESTKIQPRELTLIESKGQAIVTNIKELIILKEDSSLAIEFSEKLYFGIGNDYERSPIIFKVSTFKSNVAELAVYERKGDKGELINSYNLNYADKDALPYLIGRGITGEINSNDPYWKNVDNSFISRRHCSILIVKKDNAAQILIENFSSNFIVFPAQILTAQPVEHPAKETNIPPISKSASPRPLRIIKKSSTSSGLSLIQWSLILAPVFIGVALAMPWVYPYFASLKLALAGVLIHHAPGLEIAYLSSAAFIVGSTFKFPENSSSIPQKLIKMQRMFSAYQQILSDYGKDTRQQV